MNVSQFLLKWRQADLTERSGAHQHFCDLCDVFGHPKPAEADPKGEWFTFEKGAAKHGGGDGWADVWKKDFFAWEYKGRHKDLDAAYDQLLKYREALDNPPLLCVCDMERIEIHTNFTATATKVYRIPLLDFDKPDHIEILRALFHEPNRLRPGATREAITKEAAERLAHVADLLRGRGLDPHKVARFLDRIVFCLFAEDIGLLPENTFTQILDEYRTEPELFTPAVADLFANMARGGRFGARRIKHFDGDLFENVEVLPLEYPEIESIYLAGKLDWSAVDASIIGTLFERGMDPAKRAQLGAHYTSRADIETLVDPVVMAPLRREWDEFRQAIESLLATGRKPSCATAGLSSRAEDTVGQADRGTKRGKRAPAPLPLFKGDVDKARHEGEVMVNRFLQRLTKVHVLDPACGSGNFLYVTLQKLKDLEKEVIRYAAEHGLGDKFTPAVGPWQLHGIEISPYAFELAQLTVWIGYLQWLITNGFGQPNEPILRPMHTFECKDAILERRAASPGGSSFGVPPSGGSSFGVPPLGGSSPSVPPSGGEPPGQEEASPRPPEGGTPSAEPEWPKVDFIVGNPPFLGGNKIRQELGDEYVEALFAVYEGRVRPFADLCCYWFDKARRHVEQGKCQRAGLLATQAIRGGASREILERINACGGIFFAESDRPWILDGASVHVSMVGFDSGVEKNRLLDSAPVPHINANLTATADTTAARCLGANGHLCFMGPSAKAPLDIPESLAITMLSAGGNVHGAPNSDVIRPVCNAVDLVKASRRMWTIDFGLLDQETASKYEVPFEYASEKVKPFRSRTSQKAESERWWQYARPRPNLREAACGKPRLLVTPEVAKHRIFLWKGAEILCNQCTLVFARSDDYFFGVLHSRLHEVWARAQATQLRERESGLRYTPTTCFETFPFPWPGNVARLSEADSEVVRLAEADSAVARHSVADGDFRPGGADHGTDHTEQTAAIAEAARELNELRERWLNPPEWVEEEILEFPGTVDGPWARYIQKEEEGCRLSVIGCRGKEDPRPASEAALPFSDPENRQPKTDNRPRIGLVRYPRLVPRDAACAQRLKKRTLTNLYNERPTWLALAHQKLDAAVFAAYGWEPAMTDEEILGRLLELNLNRAKG